MSAVHGVHGVRSAMAGGADWSLQRALTVGYGVVYDYIFDRFAPYQSLSGEVLACVKAGTPADTPRRDVRVLDIGCGPGNITLLLAEAGFSALGVDPYEPLIELAREKRRAKQLANVAFQHADVATGDPRWDGAFDQVVNVHSLYAHPRPVEVLQLAAGCSSISRAGCRWPRRFRRSAGATVSAARCAACVGCSPTRFSKRSGGRSGRTTGRKRSSRRVCATPASRCSISEERSSTT